MSSAEPTTETTESSPEVAPASPPARSLPGVPGAPAAPNQAGLPGTQSWLEGLPGDLRGDPSLVKFNDVPSLAKSYVEIQSLVGRKGVILPKADDPEDTARFGGELGRPESPDAYQFEGFEAPEGEFWDPNQLEAMRPIFHAAGVTDAQGAALAQGFVDNLGQQYTETMEHLESQREEAQRAMRSKYGAAYDATYDLATRAFTHLAGDKADAFGGKRLIDGSKLIDDPDWFELFATLGKSIGEHELLGQGARSFAMTPEAAEHERAKLKMDPDFREAWLNKDHPSHKEAVARYARLTEYATPDSPQEDVVVID
jgi:hypothetical protein